MPVRENDYWLVSETRSNRTGNLTKTVSWIPLD